jgi:hypothetical protein
VYNEVEGSQTEAGGVEWKGGGRDNGYGIEAGKGGRQGLAMEGRDVVSHIEDERKEENYVKEEGVADIRQTDEKWTQEEDM